MEIYKNLGGDSGVTAYELGTNSITVRFKDGAAYLYTNQSAGSHKIEQMKKLAMAGHGLNSYINLNVKYGYEKKLR